MLYESPGALEPGLCVSAPLFLRASAAVSVDKGRFSCYSHMFLHVPMERFYESIFAHLTIMALIVSTWFVISLAFKMV